MTNTTDQIVKERKRNSIALATGALAVAAMTLATPALATSSHDDEESVELEMDLRGRIAPRCELSLGRASTTAQPDDQSGQARLPLSVDCNHPLTVEMRSVHGAMQHREAGSSNYPGFSSSLPYRATLSLEGVNARQVSASSAEMESGAVRSTGAIPFKANGSVQVDWVAQGRLLAGTYSDTIEIRVVGDS